MFQRVNGDFVIIFEHFRDTGRYFDYNRKRQRYRYRINTFFTTNSTFGFEKDSIKTKLKMF